MLREYRHEATGSVCWAPTPGPLDLAARSSSDTLAAVSVPRLPPRPFVVVVSGMPGSGKTTLGWDLSRRLHVPLVCRDDIKSGIHVSHADRDDEPWAFASTAFEAFYATIDVLVDAGASLVAEAAFHTGFADTPIAALAGRARIVHVHLITPQEVSLRRYRQRALDGLRHPAHDDLRFADEMESGRKPTDVYELTLPFSTIAVDGTDGWNPDLATIARFVLDPSSP